MVLVFADDLAESWDSAGLPGAIQVWSSAVREFVQIALIGRATAPAVIVPAVCFILSALSFGGQLILARAQASGTGFNGFLLDEAIRNFILWPSVTSALVSLVVVLSNARRGIVPLQLEP